MSELCNNYVHITGFKDELINLCTSLTIHNTCEEMLEDLNLPEEIAKEIRYDGFLSESTEFNLQTDETGKFATINIHLFTNYTPNLIPLYFMMLKYAPRAKFEYTSEETTFSVYQTNEERYQNLLRIDCTEELLFDKGLSNKFKELYNDSLEIKKEDFFQTVKTLFPNENVDTLEKAQALINAFIKENKTTDKNLYLTFHEYDFVAIETVVENYFKNKDIKVKWRYKLA